MGLAIDEQLQKLKDLQNRASIAIESDDLVQQLGGTTVYASIVDFYTIQAAKLIQQVYLKAELHQGKEPSFEPNEDTFFYDEHVSTRRITKTILAMFPFQLAVGSTGDEAKLNQLGIDYMKKINKFLNYRNSLMHHLCSPKMSMDKINKLINLRKLSTIF